MSDPTVDQYRGICFEFHGDTGGIWSTPMFNTHEEAFNLVADHNALAFPDHNAEVETIAGSPWGGEDTSDSNTDMWNPSMDPAYDSMNTGTEAEYSSDSSEYSGYSAESGEYASDSGEYSGYSAESGEYSSDSSSSSSYSSESGESGEYSAYGSEEERSG